MRLKQTIIQTKEQKNKDKLIIELTEKSEDENYDVRRDVAQNSNTPIEVLVKLADDEYEDDED